MNERKVANKDTGMMGFYNNFMSKALRGLDEKKTLE